MCIVQNYIGEFKTQRLTCNLSQSMVPPNFLRFSIIRRKKTKNRRRLKKNQQQAGIAGYVRAKNGSSSYKTDAVEFCQSWTHMRDYLVSHSFFSGENITRRCP
jgi:hypothetical protein